MKKIVFLTPADARHGFSLTGVRQIETTRDELRRAVLDSAADASVGVLVVDERLIEGAARDQIRDTERRWPGLVVVLPAPGKALRPADDSARRLIREAIGYQVRVTL